MEIIKIHIATGDQVYGQALKKALVANYKGFLVTDGDIDPLDQAGHKADLIIYDDLRRKGGKVVYLVDKESQVDEERFIFYKYSRVKSLVANLLMAYSTMTGRTIVNTKEDGLRVFTVLSTAGGLGCTTIALAMAQELRRYHGKRVLYLSLEEFPSTGDYFLPGDMNRGLKEYLYFFLRESYDRCSVPEGFLVQDYYGIEAFRSGIGSNPILDLNQGKLAQFFKFIGSLGRYDYMIVDGGNSMNQTVRNVISLSTKVVLITVEGRRNYSYRETMEALCNNSLVTKPVDVVNRHLPDYSLDETIQLEPGQGAEEFIQGLNHTREKITISYDANSFTDREGFRQISLDMDFGTDIKDLTKEILEAG